MLEKEEALEEVEEKILVSLIQAALEVEVVIEKKIEVVFREVAEAIDIFKIKKRVEEITEEEVLIEEEEKEESLVEVSNPIATHLNQIVMIATEILSKRNNNYKENQYSNLLLK